MSLLPNSGLENHPDGTGDLNAIVNGNWAALDGFINPAQGLTASQAGASVTASATIFTAENIGDKIRFATGEEATITATAGTVAVPSATCTVSIARTVAACAFNLFAAVTESPRSALARGLTKKTKAANIATGTTFIWNATKQLFETRQPETAPVLALNTNRNNVGSSSVAELSILGRAAVAVAANSLILNGQLRFELVGRIYCNGQNATFKIKLGTGINTLGPFALPAIGGQPLFAKITGFISVILVSSSVSYQFESGGCLEILEPADAGGHFYPFDFTTFFLNPTVAQNFDISIQFGSSSASHVFIPKALTLQNSTTAN